MYSLWGPNNDAGMIGGAAYIGGKGNTAVECRVDDYQLLALICYTFTVVTNQWFDVNLSSQLCLLLSQVLEFCMM